MGGDCDGRDDSDVHHRGNARTSSKPNSTASGSTALIQLSCADVGQALKIVRCSGPYEFRSTLARLGLSTGSVIQVVSKTSSGSVVVSMNEEKLGFGCAAASQIYVSAQASPHTCATRSVQFQYQI
jgi:Fe2+ transport system protein FeoA